MDTPIRVFLEKQHAYDLEKIKTFLDTSSIFSGLRSTFHGCRVLLKPNLITGRAPVLACTNGVVIQAAAEWLIDAGASVSIGDSPAFGSAGQVLKSQGIEGVIKHLELNITEFRTPVIKEITRGRKIGVAQEVLEHDFLVNLPKLKAHNQMYITCAVKNLFGVVCGIRKATAHMKNGRSHVRFGELMLDLLQLIPPSVSIADGITAMHREGPIGGASLELCCIGACSDPVALDTALLEVLELDKERCPIWSAARQRNQTGSDCGSLLFPLEKPEHFHGSGFVAPEVLNPVPFNPIRFLASSIRRMLLKVRK